MGPKLNVGMPHNGRRKEQRRGHTHPSFDGGYSHSSPFGKSPLGYSSQIGTEGGSVCPFTVAQIQKRRSRGKSSRRGEIKHVKKL